MELWYCDFDLNTKYTSIWLKNWLKIFEIKLQWISGYELVRNPLFFAFFVFFVCSSCVLRVFFVFEGLWWKFFEALEAWIRRASPICSLLRFLEAFWAWFQWPLRSRQIVWMILLRVFFNFGIEVLEGFEAWFLQSFCISEFSPPPKCLRKASIYRSLGVGERHVAKSDWWHMSQPDWSAYVIAYTC